MIIDMLSYIGQTTTGECKIWILIEGLSCRAFTRLLRLFVGSADRERIIFSVEEKPGITEVKITAAEMPATASTNMKHTIGYSRTALDQATI